MCQPFKGLKQTETNKIPLNFTESKDLFVIRYLILNLKNYDAIPGDAVGIHFDVIQIDWER